VLFGIFCKFTVNSECTKKHSFFFSKWGGYFVFSSQGGGLPAPRGRDVPVCSGEFEKGELTMHTMMRFLTALPRFHLPVPPGTPV